ncbi:hypothetical protein [Microbacterium sp. Se63.02b]|uniref:hypothetical protein n=1 Tax=Microbacterium sp. Se63.02b TaxID=2709304 RepID=UPI001FCEF449|nr:hypothetical protein [Microbacterium sp. Se63.02b]
MADATAVVTMRSAVALAEDSGNATMSGRSTGARSEAIAPRISANAPSRAPWRKVTTPTKTTKTRRAGTDHGQGDWIADSGMTMSGRTSAAAVKRPMAHTGRAIASRGDPHSAAPRTKDSGSGVP